ncbi:MAG: FAD-dependent 5-carboxymethylaminomethyl-2-thiouridine(34) oxidoreductase MnmC [Xylophilus ampelinus]
MPETVDWLEDGTPYSPRFGDRYRSDVGGGIGQAREVFLAGCGLPAAWAGRERWCVLETGFGPGLNFLVTRQAWRDDPRRPRLLHYVATEAFPVGAEALLRAAAAHPDLQAEARELHARWWGLEPGVHRLAFDGGRVLLTLCIGDTRAALRQFPCAADAVYLDGFGPAANPDMWSIDAFKAVARCCRPGTRIATWTIARAVRDGLAQCGFAVRKAPGAPPKRDNLQGEYAPAWTPRRPADEWADGRWDGPPADCVVVGSGIAGAAAAAALARRGWRVRVLDAGDAPAAGASGLPAGIVAPHVSPDDNLLSRLSRRGARIAIDQAGALLADGVDWHPRGVLEHRTDDTPGLPSRPGDWREDWSRAATAADIAAAGLPAGTVACLHRRAAWLRPARLVRALLDQPGVAWEGGVRIDRIRPAEDGSADWLLLDASGATRARAPLVVAAAGYGSRALLDGRLALNPVRGQVSIGDWDGPAPARPVNGHGSFIAGVPLDGPGRGAWVAGATFERGLTDPRPRPDEIAAAHAANLERLARLLPAQADALAPQFAAGPRTWSGVRCTASDRRPVVGPVDPAARPGLWTCTAMGSRGLTLGLLCAELLAARLHGEPLPLEPALARALSIERLGPALSGKAA